jgi:hypothetical protein
MELRHSSGLGCSVIENVSTSSANELALLELRAMPQLKFFKELASGLLLLRWMPCPLSMPPEQIRDFFDFNKSRHLLCGLAKLKIAELRMGSKNVHFKICLCKCVLHRVLRFFPNSKFPNSKFPNVTLPNFEQKPYFQTDKFLNCQKFEFHVFKMSNC